MAEIFAFCFAMVCYYLAFRFIKYLCIEIIAFNNRSQPVNLDEQSDLINNVIPLSDVGLRIEPTIDFNNNISINDQEASASPLLAKYMHDEFDLNKINRPMAVIVYPFKKIKARQRTRANLIAKENDLHRIPVAYSR